MKLILLSNPPVSLKSTVNVPQRREVQSCTDLTVSTENPNVMISVLYEILSLK